MSIRRTSVSTQDHERHFQAEVPFVDTCVRQMDMPTQQGRRHFLHCSTRHTHARTTSSYAVTVAASRLSRSVSVPAPFLKPSPYSSPSSGA